MNHREDTALTLHQLLAVLFLILFPLGTQRLFVYLIGVGGAAWLCPLLAGAVALGLVFLLGRRQLGDPLAFSAQTSRRVWAGLFLLWGLIWTAAHSVRIGSQLSDVLGVGREALTAGTLLLAVWMATGGLVAFARAGEVFALAIGAGFALILLGGIFRLRWDALLLWDQSALCQVPGGGLAVLGTLAVGSWALLFCREIRPEPGAVGRVGRWVGLLGLLLSGALLLVLGRFGPALTRMIDRPFFQMVSGLGLEGAFQRLEALVSALWFLGDASLLAFLLLVCRRLLHHLTGRAESRKQLWALAVTVLLLSLPVPIWNDVLSGWTLPLGSLLVGLLLLGFSIKNGKPEKKSKK